MLASTDSKPKARIRWSCAVDVGGARARLSARRSAPCRHGARRPRSGARARRARTPAAPACSRSTSPISRPSSRMSSPTSRAHPHSLVRPLTRTNLRGDGSTTGARDGAGGRRGQAPAAAHERPGQAGGAVRRHVPHHRLLPLELRQRQVPQDRRAHAVQEPQPRPPHQPDVALLDAARRLRDAGAGPDAARPAVVPGLGRRDLPEPQPDLRRAPRHRVRVRRRPHLPHGHARRWSTATSRPVPA